MKRLSERDLEIIDKQVNAVLDRIQRKIDEAAQNGMSKIHVIEPQHQTVVRRLFTSLRALGYSVTRQTRYLLPVMNISWSKSNSNKGAGQ